MSSAKTTSSSTPRPVTLGPLVDGLRVVRKGLTRQGLDHRHGHRHCARARHGWSVRTQKTATALLVRPHRAMRFSHFFIDLADLRGSVELLIVIMLIGGIAYFALPAAQYPEESCRRRSSSQRR